MARRAVARLAGARARPNFGNAGAVENLLSEAKLRLREGADAELDLRAFGIDDAEAEPGAADAVEATLEGLVGCGQVIATTIIISTIATANILTIR